MNVGMNITNMTMDSSQNWNLHSPQVVLPVLQLHLDMAVGNKLSIFPPKPGDVGRLVSICGPRALQCQIDGAQHLQFLCVSVTCFGQIRHGKQTPPKDCSSSPPASHHNQCCLGFMFCLRTHSAYIEFTSKEDTPYICRESADGLRCLRGCSRCLWQEIWETTWNVTDDILMTKSDFMVYCVYVVCKCFSSHRHVFLQRCRWCSMLLAGVVWSMVLYMVVYDGNKTKL